MVVKLLSSQIVRNNLKNVGIISIYNIIRSTFGPLGKDKLIYTLNNRIKITNQGLSIIKSINIQNPSALMVTDLCIRQNKELGDGTSSLVIVIYEILKFTSYRYGLIKPVLNLTIGLRLTCKVSLSIIDFYSYFNRANKNETSIFWWLYNVAKTCIKEKIFGKNKCLISKICLISLLKIYTNLRLENLKVTLVFGGSVKESFLEEGLLIKTPKQENLYKYIENPRLSLNRGKFDVNFQYIGENPDIVKSNFLKLNECSFDESKCKKKCTDIFKSGINFLIDFNPTKSATRNIFKRSLLDLIDNVNIKSIFKLAESFQLVNMATTNRTEKHGSKSKKRIYICRFDKKQFIILESQFKNNFCSIVFRGLLKNTCSKMKRCIRNCLNLMRISLIDSRFTLSGGATDYLIATQLTRISKKFNHFDRFYFEIIATSIKKLSNLNLKNNKIFYDKFNNYLKIILNPGNTFSLINYYYDLKHDKFLSSFYNGCCEPTKLKENVVVPF